MRKRTRLFFIVSEALMAVWNSDQTDFAKMRFNVGTRNSYITRTGEEQ
jgi:hypothetical protein